jgi:glycosyltransferase involved in cell wall biosynthesis
MTEDVIIFARGRIPCFCFFSCTSEAIRCHSYLHEKKTVNELYSQVCAVLEGMYLSGGYGKIFINNGSHDRSLLMLRDLATYYASVRHIDLGCNFGHQIPIAAGLDHFAGEAVIIDADLQDLPKLIPEMYCKLRKGNESLYAKRRSRRCKNWAKNFVTSMLCRILAGTTNVSIPVDTVDFRIKAVEVLRWMPWIFIGIIGEYIACLWANVRQCLLYLVAETNLLAPTPNWPSPLLT